MKIYKFFDNKVDKNKHKVQFKGGETRYIKNAGVNNQEEEDEESDVERHISPRINSIMSQNRHNNVVRVCVSRHHESIALVNFQVGDNFSVQINVN